MSDHVYKRIELVGTSTKSIEHAVETALARAHRTMRGIKWVEVGQVRGSVDGGKVNHWQVMMTIGFTLDE